MCWDMQAILRHVSWICRTPRQLRSTSRGYVERSASFAPPLVDRSNAPPASLRKAWQNRRADSGLPPLRSGFFNIQLVLRRMSDQELLQTLRILEPISRFEEFALLGGDSPSAQRLDGTDPA